MKKTPLYDSHLALGARMTDFGGWKMPLQYAGILEEHHAVRNRAGLFDVSHMGEILVEGPGSGDFLQMMVTNDISKMAGDRVVYSPMCYPDGGTVDDLLIYNLGQDKYMLVVNAANIEKDYQWLTGHAKDGVRVRDLSLEYAQIAIQGPKAQSILQRITSIALDDIRFFRFGKDVEISGIKTLVSRTGYTGEDGFEIYLPSGYAARLWEKILEEGSSEGLVPVGLGARDTLRFEASLPLYGHELSPEISPLEAGLDRFVKLNKGDFIGREALVRQSEEGLERRLTGLEMVERGIPRSGYKVHYQAGEIGFVTSGGFAPTLEKNLALALVETRYSEPGREVGVAVRNKVLKARTVPIPFYQKKYFKQKQ